MSSATNRPNFLLVIGEDTGRYLACYGDPCAHTPNLDRLAGQGCRFDEAYSTSPVCAPARSALVSGQYPMKLGTHHMRSTLRNPLRVFTHELREAGYHVSWPTKLDFNFEPLTGWRNDDQPWLDRLARRAMPQQPWLCYVNIGVTHESSMWPSRADEGGPHPAYFPPGTPRIPEQCDPATVPVPAYVPDTPAVRADIARHYDNVAELDRQVGEILDALQQSGQAEQTYVIFLADHGRGLPREKRWPYTAGLQMPLLVRGPEIEPGTVDSQLVSWVDIAPTILSLAGAKVPESYDGQVFLGPEAAEPRAYVFGGRDRMDEAFDRVRIARDHRYHYVRNFYPQLPYAQRIAYMEKLPTMQELRRLRATGELKGSAAVFMQDRKAEEELYDAQADPDCVHNLAVDPAHAADLARMRAALEQWIERMGDLGAVPERELIERGLIEDRISEYRQRIEPLPEAHRLGPSETTVIEPTKLPEPMG